MNLSISEHFTFSKLFRFTFPSILMMVFTSIYSVVDGLFVSNIVGKTAFSAINLVYPILFILSSLGFLFGSGGSALVAMLLGEGEKERGLKTFTFLTLVLFLLTSLISLIAFIFWPVIIRTFGATESLFEDCMLYGRIYLLGLPFFSLQNFFQTFFVTASRPKLGLLFTLGAGLLNAIFDFVFIYLLKFGLAGAGGATIIGMLFGSVFPVLYFLNKSNKSLLHFIKPSLMFRELLRTITNGSSELLSSISGNLVSLLFNWQLLRFFGEDGVASYGTIMYVSFIFVAIFLGFSMGVAPLVSYNFGSRKNSELQNLFKKSILIMSFLGLFLCILSLLLSKRIVSFFVGYDEELMNLTLFGFHLLALGYIFTGINIFGSSFFTALNNGLISLLLSLLRTIVFQVSLVLLLPYFFGKYAIWFSSPLSEVLTFIVTLLFLIVFRTKYAYTKGGERRKKESKFDELL